MHGGRHLVHVCTVVDQCHPYITMIFTLAIYNIIMVTINLVEDTNFSILDTRSTSRAVALVGLVPLLQSSHTP